MSDLHQVITPENVELDYEIAGIGSRFLAIAVDTLIQSFFSGGIIYGLSLIGLEQLNLETEIKNFSHSLVGAGLIFLGVLVWPGYYVILESAMNGQTLGKRLCNIRVRKDLGYAPTFWDILLRNLIRLVDFAPFGYVTGFTTMFLNPQAKRLGDFAAGTIVVKELPRKNAAHFLNNPASIHLATNPGQPESFPDDSYPWLNPLLAHLSQQNYFLLQNLYGRRDQLTNYPKLSRELLLKVLRPVSDQEELAIEAQEAPEILEKLIQRYEKAYFS